MGNDRGGPPPAGTLQQVTESPHPLLPPATPVLDVGGDTVQVGGVDGGPGLRVHPAGPVRDLLHRLDGRRSERAVRAEAAAAGLTGADVGALLAGLRAAGLLHELSPPDLLAASGVGRVHVRDRGTTRAGDAIVGGAAADDEGRPRSMAAADAVRRASPLTDLRPLPAEQPPDLVVLCRPWAAADPLSTALQRSGTPHLVATVREETGIVGPLVLPGRTGCLRCAEARRRDDDPTWPRLAAQLIQDDDPAPSGSTITCLLTALTAAVQVLTLLDGGADPVTVEGTLELRPPALLPRLRRWSPYPGCDCGGAAQGGGDAERGQ